MINNCLEIQMPRIPSQISLASVLLALLAGCASAPATRAAPKAADCRQLSAEIASAEEARRAAMEKQQSAWKAVIPFAVAARYASAKSSSGRADQRRAELQTQFKRQGCAGHVD